MAMLSRSAAPPDPILRNFSRQRAFTVTLSRQRFARENSLSTSPQTFFGPIITEEGILFRFWAPFYDTIQLQILGEEPRPMQVKAEGWHELSVATAHTGSLYQFILPDGLTVPDPASRFQPQDVHGPSEVIDPHSYDWQDGVWKGRPWNEAVIYELHVGAFTPEGTFRAIIDKLDALIDVGITAIELMPIADFPGARNWGYDGVLLFAPDSSYGRPDDLKALIDAAHAKGMMVFLDVVYNHFGPDGNYLPCYAPIFKDKHTPWGQAINYDAAQSEAVRELVASNVAYWISEFHFDGLRFDAVHAIEDESATHLLDVIAARAKDAGAGRLIHLIVENEENQSSRLMRRADGTPQSFTAQWNDDVHHVLHTAATNEDVGYYVEYKGKDDMLARALAEGFAFQGEMMAYRGSARGEPTKNLPPTAFIAFAQNHDQIGNRAFGDRLISIAPKEAVRAVTAIYLLLPQIPMLFMGEDWGATQPFPFFCDFAGELSNAVREGRRAEFAKFPEFQDPDKRETIPDPTAEKTFLSAKLRWDERKNDDHVEWLRLYKELLALRHMEIIPHLDGCSTGTYDIIGPSAVRVIWQIGNGEKLTLLANLSAQNLTGVERPSGTVIWCEGEMNESVIAPWTTLWSLEMKGGANAA